MPEAPKLLLAHSWDGEKDLTGWWLSEKLDGVRAYWDGTKFISRLGNAYNAPDWFRREMPPVSLDGELWIERGSFNRVVGAVKKHSPIQREWEPVRYYVFDVPTLGGGFEYRMSSIANLAKDFPFIVPVPHLPCEGNDALRIQLQYMDSIGAEGLMARMPGSFYEGKRSSTLLKIKSFKDAEAIVLSYQAGKGKHAGRMGALRCRMLPDGPLFKIGTGFSDHDRENPPKVGSTVSFAYQELTKDGVPRFPSFMRVRND